MSSAELRNKTELTTIAGTEWLYTQQTGTPYTVKKLQINTLLNTVGYTTGEDLKMLSVYKSISGSFPWYCMSLPDETWTTAHYSADFIAKMRSRKVIYDELNTNQSAFTGSWSTGTFTLDNNTANNAMLAELAEEYLFAGSPVTNWRLLNDGTYDYNVTSITVASRQITVSTADHTPSGTSISIYLHRVYGSTTSARHFSWAGLGLYMAGNNKVTGLRRRDAMQGHLHSVQCDAGLASGSSIYRLGSGSQQNIGIGNPITDGTNGTPRTNTKTRIESGTLLLYLYVGSYTA